MTYFSHEVCLSDYKRFSESKKVYNKRLDFMGSCLSIFLSKEKRCKTKIFQLKFFNFYQTPGKVTGQAETRISTRL